MTDTYLRSLGFAPALPNTSHANRTSFSKSWRYQFNHLANDGASLFIEHPLGIDICRLSALAAPLGAQDVFASIGLHDRPALEVAMKAFYAAHGGMGSLVPASPDAGTRPQRRQP